MNVIVVIVIILAALLIVFSLGFLFMIKPNKRRDVSLLIGKMYAHRGLHDDEVPENSITAFRLAKEAGYGVELDVQMTKDEKLVVFHDGNLNRMCGKDDFLRNYTYDELRQFRLKDTDEQIPLFCDVLKVLDKTDLICEIKGDNGAKNYEICQKTYRLLEQYSGNYCMESFSPYLVGWFKKNHPEIIRGQLSENFMSYKQMNKVIAFAMSHLLVNIIGRPDFLAYKHQDTNTFGYKVCSKLFHPFLVGWTARGKEEQDSAWTKFEAVIFEKNPQK